MTAPAGPRDASAVRALLAQRAGSDAVAYVEGVTGARMSWSDVAGRAEAWVATAPALDPALRGRDGRPRRGSARVGLVVSDPLEMAAAVLGALSAGICVAPLDPSATGPELRAKARLLGLSAVVAGPDDTGATPVALASSGIDVWEIRGGAPRRIAPRDGSHARPALPADAAVVLSSSGTSGAPKLIPITAAALLDTAGCVVSHHELGPQDTGYSPLPLSHINGLVVGVVAALIGGHRLVVDRRFSASGYWDVVAREQVTWLNAVPAILAVLARRPCPSRPALARVAFARSASAPLPAATAERWTAATGIPVIETYGMTEAASQITSMPRTGPSRRTGSVGVAVGCELRIVGEGDRPVPAGTVGAVHIRGDRIVGRYWNAAGATPATRPATTADGWLDTGDLGCLDEDGFLTLTGRADDVINRGGEKVYPREIEEVLLADPDVRSAAVVGRPDPVAGEVPVAFVVAAHGTCGDDLVARLQARAARELSRFRRPAAIVVVDSLPSGLNGKIRRAELRRSVAAAT